MAPAPRFTPSGPAKMPPRGPKSERNAPPSGGKLNIHNTGFSIAMPMSGNAVAGPSTRPIGLHKQFNGFQVPPARQGTVFGSRQQQDHKPQQQEESRHLLARQRELDEAQSKAPQPSPPAAPSSSRHVTDQSSNGSSSSRPAPPPTRRSTPPPPPPPRESPPPAPFSLAKAITTLWSSSPSTSSRSEPHPDPPPSKPPASNYKAKLLPAEEITRNRISIAIPMMGNGFVRPRPPHLPAQDTDVEDKIGQLLTTPGRKLSIVLPSPPAKAAPPPPRESQPSPPPLPPQRAKAVPPPPPSPPYSRRVPSAEDARSRRDSTTGSRRSRPDRSPSPQPRRKREHDDSPGVKRRSNHKRSPSPESDTDTESKQYGPARPADPSRTSRLRNPSPPPKRSVSPPRTRRAQTPPHKLEKSEQPGPSAGFPAPTLHFREFHRAPPAADSDNESESEEAGPQEEVLSPVERAPSPPRERTPSPKLPPEWAPPECVRQRAAESFVTKYEGGKEVSKRFDGLVDGQPVDVVDPRIGARRKHEEIIMFSELHYDWDNDVSLGKKPLQPPTAVLITGLHPLTTTEQVKKLLRPYGAIRELDSKMDPKSGGQLGICWVRFDKKGSKEPMSAHDVAVIVAKSCDGKRVGMDPTERIRVVLDGRGLRAEKAVKEEMAKRYPPKVKPAPPAAVPPPSSLPPPLPPVTALLPSQIPTRPHVPAPNQAFPMAPSRATPLASTSLPNGRPVPVAVPLSGGFRPPSRPASYVPRVQPSHPVQVYPMSSRPTSSHPIPSHPMASYPPARPSSEYYKARPGTDTYRPPTSRPAAATQQLASSFTDAPFRGRSRTDTYIAGSHGASSSRSHRSYSRSSSSSSETDSGSEDDKPRNKRSNAVSKVKSSSPGKAKKEEELIRKALEENGYPAVFVAVQGGATQVETIYVKDHFQVFKPESIHRIPIGFYILFSDSSSAQSSTILNQTQISDRKITVKVKHDHVKAAASPEAGTGAKSNRKNTTISKTKRPVAAKIPASVVAAKKAELAKKRSYSTDSSDEEEVAKVKVVARKRAPSVSSTSDLSEEEVVVAPKPKAKAKPKPKAKVQTKRKSVAASDEGSVAVRTPTSIKEDVLIMEGESEEEEEEAPVVLSGKKRAGPVKVSKKGKKARITSPAPLVEAPPPPTPEVAEIKLVPKKPPVKKAKPKKIPPGPLGQLVADGVIEDEEDAYWLSQALAEAPEPPILDDDIDDFETPLLPVDHPLYHTSGSWRAHGIRKVPHAVKSAYLPQRNRAQAAAEASAVSQQGNGLTTGRAARVTGRRLAHDMETTRKTTMAATSESDLFAFNQLRIRKKQLRFARSAIEGYGLYAMETIQKGEMVCEYVGELIRSVVADVREAKYLKQGIGSSYLFRIDGDIVCDATFRGSVSRLINHSCDPSANAKIISVNGQSKIVIYARRTIHPGEETTYNYLFPLEPDPSLRVPCLCGTAICQGFLNWNGN